MYYRKIILNALTKSVKEDESLILFTGISNPLNEILTVFKEF